MFDTARDLRTLDRAMVDTTRSSANPRRCDVGHHPISCRPSPLRCRTSPDHLPTLAAAMSDITRTSANPRRCDVGHHPDICQPSTLRCRTSSGTCHPSPLRCRTSSGTCQPSPRGAPVNTFAYGRSALGPRAVQLGSGGQQSAGSAAFRSCAVCPGNRARPRGPLRRGATQWAPPAPPRLRGCSDRPRVASGNRLEALHGDLKGLHGIRVNDQWRIVFRWTAEGPDAVDVRDYH
jgi:hypothetical protein